MWLSVLDLAAQLVFMLVLILLGAGWAITRHHIPYKRVLVVILSLFGVAYLAFFIWENVGVDAASTLYVYESAPGIWQVELFVTARRNHYFSPQSVDTVLVLVVSERKLLGRKVGRGHRNVMFFSHPNKRKFYMMFGCIFSIWYLALPVVVIFASTQKWFECCPYTIQLLLLNGTEKKLSWECICALILWHLLHSDSSCGLPELQVFLWFFIVFDT
jgi:membrane-associated HD superfamily phosphohydrolase